MNRFECLLLVQAFILMFEFGANAQTTKCTAFIAASERNRGSNTVVRARNVSSKPIVAYVITNTPSTSSDIRSYSLLGVFTEGDKLPPGKTMEIGTMPRRRVNGLLNVDYVRLADGTTCGPAITEDARRVAERFR